MSKEEVSKVMTPSTKIKMFILLKNSTMKETKLSILGSLMAMGRWVKRHPVQPRVYYTHPSKKLSHMIWIYSNVELKRFSKKFRNKWKIIKSMTLS